MKPVKGNKLTRSNVTLGLIVAALAIFFFLAVTGKVHPSSCNHTWC